MPISASRVVSVGEYSYLSPKWYDILRKLALGVQLSYGFVHSLQQDD